MEISILLAENIFSMFLMMLVGFVVVKIKLLKGAESKILSTIVVYVLSPCVILEAFQIDYTTEKLNGLLIALVVSVVLHGIFIVGTNLLSKIFHFNSIEKASLVYTNAGNLVIPLIVAVLGPEWVFYSCAFTMVQTVLVWTHGVAVIKGTGMNADVKKILLNPNTLAVILGVFMFLFGIKFPDPIQGTLSGFGNCIAPISMMVVGMLIGEVDLKWVFQQKRPYMVCFIRLMILPMITLGIFKIVQGMVTHNDLKYILMVVLFAASAPAAAMVTQLAQVFERDSKYASVINIMSVMFCIVTMPLMVLILEKMW